MERFREVGGAFGAATHYLVAWNFINHVSALVYLVGCGLRLRVEA